MADGQIWLKPFGSWASQDERNNIAGFDSNTYGLMVGADTALGDDSKRLGVAASYSATSVDSNSVTADQTADITAYQLSIYGSHEISDDTAFDFNIGLGLNSTDGERTIDFASIDRIASSDYDGTSAHIGAEIGRAFDLDSKSTIIPSLRANYTLISNDSYTETGADALNLVVDGQDTDELVLGVGSLYQRSLNDAVTFNGELGVGYDFLNEQASITSSFSGGGSSFVTYGIDPSPWLISGGLGLTVEQGSGLEFTASYEVESRSDFLNQTASLKLLMPF